MKRATWWCLILIVLLMASPGLSQRGGEDTDRAPDQPAEETPPTEDSEPEPEPVDPPQVVADGALKDLSAWRADAARSRLEQHRPDIGNTIPFKTAWSYLLATEQKLDEATTSLQTATQGDTADPVAPYLLGEVRSWKNQQDAARQAWRKAKTRAQAQLAESPDNARANYWLGATLNRLGEFGNARNHLAKALEKDFSPAMTNYQIGLTWIYEQKWNNAVASFNSCLEADNGFAHAYYYRARAYKALGNTEQMLVDLGRFLDLAPDAREATAARSMLRAGG